MAQLVARQSHYLKVIGSNPVPATLITNLHPYPNGAPTLLTAHHFSQIHDTKQLVPVKVILKAVVVRVLQVIRVGACKV